MLNNYRKTQIKNIFNEVNLKNKDLQLIKLNKNNYKFNIKNRVIYITRYNKNNYYFDYKSFDINEYSKKVLPTFSLIKMNDILEKILKKNG